MINNIRKYGVILVIISVISSFLYFSLWEQNLIKGVKLNPYQIDEVEIIKGGGILYTQQGIRIHDKEFISSVIKEIKEASFIKETFPLDDSLLTGNRYLMLLRDGESIQAHIEIFSGRGQEFSEGIMVTGDRYYHSIPSGIKQLFQLESKEIALETKNADKWLHWRPLVILDGQPYYSYFAGDQWSDIEFTKKFKVKKSLDGSTVLPIEEDPKGLLEDDLTSTFPVGTDIYHGNEWYFVKGEKESNNWQVLLPYGQSAHWLGLEQEEDVTYWSGQFTSYFVVTNSEDDIFLLSSQDPNSPENDTLQWDKDKSLFISTKTGMTYDKTGKATKEGYAPMLRFPSKVLKDVVFFSYY